MKAQWFALAMGLSLAVLVGCRAPAPAGVPSLAPATAPAPTTTIPPTQQPNLVEVQVYFLDMNRFNDGALPFERPVVRQVLADANLPQAVLQAYFAGPTQAEQAQGLQALTSGFTGFTLEVEDGYARVHLSGPCASMGASYTVAQPIIANLRQFADIRYVKIYDSEGVTGDPDGATNSIPPCLEP